MGNKKKSEQINKSKFKRSVESSLRRQKEKKMPDELRNKKILEKIKNAIKKISNGEDRILFYCPDIPFPTEMMKIMYESVYYLRKDNINAQILHEYKGFKNNWLDEKYVNDVPVKFMSADKKDLTPEFSFNPTDTVVVTDGFTNIMEQLAKVEMIQKVVLALGFYGLATIKPFTSFQNYNFNDVIAISEDIKNGYKKVFGDGIRYNNIKYIVDEFIPTRRSNKYLSINLSVRNRELAQQIINTFYLLYPELSFISFKVLKKLKYSEYKEALSKSLITLFIDEGSGFPIVPLESLKSRTPVISFIDSGTMHYEKFINVTPLTLKNPFYISNVLKERIIDILKGVDKYFKEDKEFDMFIKDYNKSNFAKQIIDIFRELREDKVKYFVSAKDKFAKLVNEPESKEKNK